MKILSKFIIVLLASFATNSVYANPIYAIDSSQSYVSAYVPSWTAYSYSSFWLPAPIVIWGLDWVLEKFQLSGNFVGTSEVSPWEPAWAHLTITDAHLVSQLPSYAQGPILPGQLTYSVSGGVVQQAYLCENDPFAPPQFGSGSCWQFLTGVMPYLAGTFDGETLKITGGSGAPLPMGFAPFFADDPKIPDPGPPPPDLYADFFPKQWVDYQIVANAVPEPGSLPLVLLGGLMIVGLAFERRAAK